MFIDYFLEVIRSCDTSSTYKMAWAKALTHIAHEINSDNLIADDYVEIHLKDIGLKFLSYYWDQDVFFKLNQNSNPTKLAEIVTLVREVEKLVNEMKGSNQPIKFHRAEIIIRTMENCYFDKMIQKVVRILKHDVSYRFIPKEKPNKPSIYAPLYQYEKNKDSLQMKVGYLDELKENTSLILDVINLKWILILEQYNNSPRIGKKVRHMDYEIEGRKSLKKYHRHLLLENPEMKCFICGESVNDSRMSVDHVIPWSFMYSDDIWNLVFVHHTCNSRKSNTIPTEVEIEMLKERNSRLLKIMKKHPEFANTKLCFDLEDSLMHDLARRFWVQCLG